MSIYVIPCESTGTRIHLNKWNKLKNSVAYVQCDDKLYAVNDDISRGCSMISPWLLLQLKIKISVGKSSYTEVLFAITILLFYLNSSLLCMVGVILTNLPYVAINVRYYFSSLWKPPNLDRYFAGWVVKQMSKAICFHF